MINKDILKKAYDSWKEHTADTKFDTLDWVFERVNDRGYDGGVRCENKHFDSFEEFYAKSKDIFEDEDEYTFSHIKASVNTSFAEYTMEIYKDSFGLYFKKHESEILDSYKENY